MTLSFPKRLSTDLIMAVYLRLHLMLLRCTGGQCAERQCDCSRSYFPDRHLKPRPILRMCTQSLCPTSWNRRHNHSRCGIARKSVVQGKSVSVREGLGGRRIIKKKK